MLTEESLAALVQDFQTLLLEIDNMFRLTEPAVSDEERRARLKAQMELREEVQLDLGRAGIDASLMIEARHAGDFTVGPRDPLLRRPVAGTPSTPAVRRAAFEPTAIAVEEPTLFSELSRRFLEHQKDGGLWDAQTYQQATKTFSIFLEHAGDHALHTYQRSDASALKDILQRLPFDYGKAALFRGRSLQEIVELDAGRSERAPRLTTRTVKRHVSALSALWRWAINEKYATGNLFQGFSFPSTLRANEQREMWATEELQLLFRSPIWTGCQSEARRSQAGSRIIRDEKFWLPLIALYSGMRQEEICQLQLEDLRQVEGHWVFDINARPPRKLKNRNAVRKVPIHSRLLELGLLKYADDLSKAGHTTLFPGLSRGGADGRLGHGYSKWFTRYRKDVQLYRKGVDFHSFRHTATTLMQRANVPIAAIDELTGHATPGETARYSHGLTMQQLVAAIEGIDLHIDLRFLENGDKRA